jgi:hypothetical protein
MTAAPRRIAIIGNAGGGKSVLARQLGDALGLPVHSVDDAQWLPGWQQAPPDDLAALHASWLARPTWIIDGWGPWTLIHERFAHADLVVVVDFPLQLHVQWALQRQDEVARGVRTDWPPAGCDAAAITGRLLDTIERVHRELRPVLLALAGEPAIAPRVRMVRTPGELATLRDTLAVRAGSSA